MPATRRARRLRAAAIDAGVLLLLVGALAVWGARHARQDRLDEALGQASERRDVAAVTRALDAGANPNARLHRDSPESFWSYLRNLMSRRHGNSASSHDRTALVLTMERRPVLGTNAVQLPTECPGLVAALLAGGADPNVKDETGETPLMLAAEGGWLTVGRMLLARGARVDSVAGVSPGTALNTAAERGDLNYVSLLLSYGADPNQIDHYGGRPLWRAAASGHAEVVRRLIAAGVRLDEPDARGVTAVEHASRSRQTDCVRILLAAGAKPPRSRR